MSCVKKNSEINEPLYDAPYVQGITTKARLLELGEEKAAERGKVGVGKGEARCTAGQGFSERLDLENSTARQGWSWEKLSEKGGEKPTDS